MYINIYKVYYKGLIIRIYISLKKVFEQAEI